MSQSEDSRSLQLEGGRKKHSHRRIGFWLGLGAFFLLLFSGHYWMPGNPSISKMAAIAALMAIWWISDAIPLAATSLIPLVLFPLLGISTGKEIAPSYINSIIFLFLGGFLIALAMERWDLHKRIALAIIGKVGGSPGRLVLGFMLATAFLSMWISNTATTIMMLAIALAVIRSEEENFGREKTAPLTVSLLLGIAYSASAGGIATLVGTPPNLSLVQMFDVLFPYAEAAGYSISFGQWMLLGLPITALLLIVIWFLLCRVFFRCSPDLQLSAESIRIEKEKLGAITREQWAVLIIFTLCALLWIFRKDLDLGEFTVRGWSRWLPTGSNLDDGTIAIFMALILFIIPARNKPSDADEREEVDKSYGTLLDFGVFKKIPWHIILLFGGGFAMAKGFQVSGLSEWVGSSFSGLQDTPTSLLIAMVCAMLTFLTELTSNTATTEMILPILASIATAAKLHPLLLMIPAALSASCAFMMPVATPPNAIVFGSGKIKISQMVKVGLILNVVGILVITVIFSLVAPVAFDIHSGVFPDWAETDISNKESDS